MEVGGPKGEHFWQRQQQESPEERALYKSQGSKGAREQSGEKMGRIRMMEKAGPRWVKQAELAETEGKPAGCAREGFRPGLGGCGGMCRATDACALLPHSSDCRERFPNGHTWPKAHSLGVGGIPLLAGRTLAAESP